MRYAFSLVAALAWGLWFGGLMALFLFVQTMFDRSRTVAVDAAPMLFLAFEKYQLALAAVAVLATFAWWVTTRSGRVLAFGLCLALAVLGAVASPTLITPRLERLRLTGQSDTPEFRALHGRSMMIYVCEAAVLLIGGIILPVALREPRGARVDARQLDATPPAPATPHV